MRLSNRPTPPVLPFPLRPDPSETDTEEPPPGRTQGCEDQPLAHVTGELVDLVANHRPDLLKTLLDVLHDSELTRAPAERLVELIAACGLTEAPSPCAQSSAIADDLDELAATPHRWTHPAQIVRRPNLPALYHLCTARLSQEGGPKRQRLEAILPRLERAARLTRKAASRRSQEASRQSR